MAAKIAKNPTDRVTVRLPVHQIQAIAALVSAERFRNTTDVIYQALKVFLEAQGTGAKQVLESEWGMDEIRRMAAEKEQLRKQVADLLNKLQ